MKNTPDSEQRKNEKKGFKLPPPYLWLSVIEDAIVNAPKRLSIPFVKAGVAGLKLSKLFKCKATGFSNSIKGLGRKSTVHHFNPGDVIVDNKGRLRMAKQVRQRNGYKTRVFLDLLSPEFRRKTQRFVGTFRDINDFSALNQNDFRPETIYKFPGRNIYLTMREQNGFIVHAELLRRKLNENGKESFTTTGKMIELLNTDAFASAPSFFPHPDLEHMAHITEADKEKIRYVSLDERNEVQEEKTLYRANVLSLHRMPILWAPQPEQHALHPNS